MIIDNIIPMMRNNLNSIICEITNIFDKYSEYNRKHYILDDNTQQGDELLFFIRIIGKTIGNIHIDKYTYKINCIFYNTHEYKTEITKELNNIIGQRIVFIENHNIAANTINLASIIPDSLVNGEGLRNVIYFQGCSLKCKGCFNEHTWEFNVGKNYKIERIVKIIKNNSLSQNVTLSGGHPLEQIDGCCKLITELKRSLKSNIWLFTGYTFEKILQEAVNKKQYKTILYNTDVIVDGKFDIDKKQEGLKYRGSTNQRIINVKESIKHNNIILLDI